MAIEIMRGISGTMGIILTVPITSLNMTFLLTRKNKESAAENANQSQARYNKVYHTKYPA